MISSIRPSATTKATSASRARGGTSGGASFSASSATSTSAGATPGIVPTLSVASIDAVMALQAVDDPAGRRARAVNRGTRILDDLDGLKIALLEGRISTEQLNRIIGLIAANREESGDSDLDDVLDGIDLRAQVELAKLGH